jgi:antitoxin HicB
MPARFYRVILKPDTEQGGYWVEVPALPGCYTQGDTIEEAIEMAKDVIALYIEDLVESGEPIPVDDADETPSLFIKVAA